MGDKDHKSELITESIDSVINKYIRKWLDIPINGTLLLLKLFKHGSHSAFADFQWAVYTI